MYKLYFWLLMSFTVLHIVCLLYNPIQTKVDNPAAFILMMQNLVSILVYYSGNLKHYLLIVLRKELETLVRFMEDEMPYDGMIIPGKSFVLTYGMVLGSTGLGWICYGFFAVGPNNLIFDENFPWDESQGAGFVAALSYQVLASNLCCIQHFGVDSIAVIVCFKLYKQIGILKSILSQVGYGQNDRQLLKQAVELHALILKAIRLLNDLYKYIILFQTVYLVLHSCIIIYCIIKTDNYYYIAAQLIPMMYSAYTQLFVYCTVGQNLTSQMDDLTRSCYDNCWYLATKETRRSLWTIMICARKPVLIEAFGITAALNQTYLKSVQESFTYFIFLRTVEANMVEMNKAVK